MSVIGIRIIELETVDSTNLYAERILADGEVEEGTVIWAHHQTAGRGQGENAWISEPGKNLTLSIILFPHFLPPGEQFFFNKAIALGVHDFLGLFVQEVSIKWPNDLCIGRKKAGGILIQHQLSGNQLTSTIAGIGININQTRFDHHLPNPASLTQILRQELVLKEAVHQLIDRLNFRYRQLKTGSFAQLDVDYIHALLDLGENRLFQYGKEITEGIIRGVDESGRLLVELPGKGIMAFLHGEIGYAE